jgi:hypothetical protein
VAYALLALAVAAVALGPRGQRPVNAAMLGSAAFAAVFFGLRGVGHPWLAASAAIVAGMLAAVFGVIADAWGTAALLASLFAAAAGAGMAALKWTWPPVAALAGSIGLYVGITRQRKLEIFLPPLFAAVFAALGASIGWAPHRTGALLYPLNDVRWVLAVAAGLAVPFAALAMFRDRARKARLEARTPEMDDEDLKKQIAARQGDYERAAQQAQAARDAEAGREAQALQEAQAALDAQKTRDPQNEPDRGN